MNILRIDSSAKIEGSHSRDLIDGLLRNLEQEGRVVRRDLVDAIPQIDAAWIAANTTPDDERTDLHRQTLALSDALVGELEAADLYCDRSAGLQFRRARVVEGLDRPGLPGATDVPLLS